jgi:tetratricopeptide (TPR) repeat protein
MDEGNLEEARGYLERVVKGAPGNPEPYWRLAVLCLVQERNDEALGHLKNGLAAFPNNPNLMDVQAVALARKGRFAEAKDWARKALERVDPATGGGAVKVITRHLEEISAGRVPQL